MLRIFFILFFINTNVYSQCCQASKIKEIDRKLNIESLQYQPNGPIKERFLYYYKPSKFHNKVKASIKIGFNKNQLTNLVKSDSTDTKNSNTLIDNLSSELDQIYLYNLVKYEVRVKIYMNKVYRILFTAQINEPNSMYSAGLIAKF